MPFQELRAFLSDSRARLLTVVGDIAPDLLAKRPAPQKWSPIEVMEHLALAEEWYLQIVSGLVEEGRREGLHYTEGMPRNTDSIAALSAQIDIRKPLMAPDFIHPTGSASLPALLERLGRSRQGLLELLPALEALDTDRLCFQHPTVHFTLNACQWVHLSGVHDRLHARQIRQALENAS